MERAFVFEPAIKDAWDFHNQMAEIREARQMLNVIKPGRGVSSRAT